MTPKGVQAGKGRVLAALAPVLVFFSLVLTSEWLFLSTKPSFLSAYSVLEKIGIWLAALIPSLVVLTIAFVLARAALNAFGRGGVLVFRSLVSFTVAALQTILAVLLVDNFVYSLFDIGLKVFAIAERRLVSFVVLVLFLVLFSRRWSRLEPGRLAGTQSRIAGAALLAIVILAAAVMAGRDERVYIDPKAPESLPNILIVSSDAIEAEHMSAYGYEVDTTPFLLEKKSEFLVAENSFTNNSITRGSIASLLTGKYPTTMQVYYSSDVLLGADQYEHLPGMLRKLGYRALDMSVRWYADAKDFNLRGGFDEANFRTVYSCAGGLGLEYLCTAFAEPVLLIEQVADRVLEKFQLISPLTGETAADTMKTRQEWSRDFAHKDNARILRVGQPKHYYHQDEARIVKAKEFMGSDSNRPFFVHLHMMASHGPRYTSADRVFSAGLTQTRQWESEFYDDSILKLDDNIREIYRFLEGEDLLEDTILVISSDHGTDWRVDTRLPLLIRFPAASTTGTVSANTQRIDVAPTLLDFLELEIPAWMEGRSLLGMLGDPGRKRPIFSAWPTMATTPSGDGVARDEPVTQFHSLGGLMVIVCDEVLSWHFASNSTMRHKVEGHTRPCVDAEAPGDEELQTLIRSHLARRGYNFD